VSAFTPTPLAHAAAERLRVQLSAGEFDETLRELTPYRLGLAKRPLLDALANTLAKKLLEDEWQARAQAYRDFVQIVGLRSQWANQLISVTTFDAISGDGRILHIWPQGESRGERHLTQAEAGSNEEVEVACGRVFAVGDIDRLVPRGAWQQPTFDNEGSPWQYRRCRACEAFAQSAADCVETPRAWPLLAPADLMALRTQTQARLRAKLPRALARTNATEKLRVHAMSVIRETLTDVVAARLAEDGDVVFARLQGYPTRAARLPTAAEWRQLLNEFKPTAANAKRYRTARSSVVDGVIVSQFERAWTNLLADLNFARRLNRI
jgi:hypothetical protein